MFLFCNFFCNCSTGRSEEEVKEPKLGKAERTQNRRILSGEVDSQFDLIQNRPKLKYFESGTYFRRWYSPARPGEWNFCRFSSNCYLLVNFWEYFCKSEYNVRYQTIPKWPVDISRIFWRVWNNANCNIGVNVGLASTRVSFDINLRLRYGYIFKLV